MACLLRGKKTCQQITGQQRNGKDETGYGGKNTEGGKGNTGTADTVGESGSKSIYR